MITPEQIGAGTSEHSQQTAVFAWSAQSGIPELKWLFAVPNGFYGSAAQKGKMKAEGLRNGVPDIWLPVPMQLPNSPQYYGLVIELKIGKNKPTDEQQEWIDFLNAKGYWCEVCYGWEAARDMILKYLGKV